MPTVHPVPEGFRTLTPHLVCADAAAAMDFYARAFGAVEVSRLPAPNGKVMHGSMRIGDSMLMLVDETPAWGTLGPLALKGSPVTIHVYVDDVDAAFARAVGAGATAKMPVTDMFWGDRYGMVTDPYGHLWSMATHVRDVTMDDMQQGMREMAGPGDKP